MAKWVILELGGVLASHMAYDSKEEAEKHFMKGRTEFAVELLDPVEVEREFLKTNPQPA